MRNDLVWAVFEEEGALMALFWDESDAREMASQNLFWDVVAREIY